MISQALRYSVVSGVCLLLGLTLIPLFTRWGLHYSIATCMAFGLIAVVGFFLHSFWTFGVERSLMSFIRYVSSMAFNLPLTIMLIGFCDSFVGLSITVSTAIASAVLIVWNYLAIRWAVLHRISGEKK